MAKKTEVQEVAEHLVYISEQLRLVGVNARMVQGAISRLKDPKAINDPYRHAKTLIEEMAVITEGMTSWLSELAERLTVNKPEDSK